MLVNENKINDSLDPLPKYSIDIDSKSKIIILTVFEGTHKPYFYKNKAYRRDKNAGEIRSMAMAFAKDFEYFISDDGEARVAAKKYLQKMDGTYLNTIRMKDVIQHIKENTSSLGIDRKTAKKLFLFGTSPKLAQNQAELKKSEAIREHLKNDFDNNLWPL